MPEGGAPTPVNLVFARVGAVFAGLYLTVGLRALLRAGDATAVVFLLPFLALLALAIRAGRARSEPRTLLDAGWPLLLWPLLYTGAVHLLMLDPDRFVDGPLARADALLLPLRAGLPAWALGGPVEELANTIYASYYVVIPAGFVWAYARRGPRAAAWYSAALFVSLFACAAVWLVWPAGGWHPHGSPDGAPYGPFTAIVRVVYAVNPHYAGAFPSSHVALSAAAAGLFVALGASRAWLLWPVAMAWATVYGQYHYAVDSPPALLIGGLAAIWAAGALGATAPAAEGGFDGPIRPPAGDAGRPGR